MQLHMFWSTQLPICLIFSDELYYEGFGEDRSRGEGQKYIFHRETTTNTIVCLGREQSYMLPVTELTIKAILCRNWLSIVTEGNTRLPGL